MYMVLFGNLLINNNSQTGPLSMVDDLMSLTKCGKGSYYKDKTGDGNHFKAEDYHLHFEIFSPKTPVS